MRTETVSTVDPICTFIGATTYENLGFRLGICGCNNVSPDPITEGTNHTHVAYLYRPEVKRGSLMGDWLPGAMSWVVLSLELVTPSAVWGSGVWGGVHACNFSPSTYCKLEPSDSHEGKESAAFLLLTCSTWIGNHSLPGSPAPKMQVFSCR